MINTYGYMVIRNKPNKIPLTVVEVRHTLHAGFHVFASAMDALNYLEKLKKEIGIYPSGDLRYDTDFEFSESLVKEYQNAEKLKKGDAWEIYINYEN